MIQRAMFVWNIGDVFGVAFFVALVGLGIYIKIEECWERRKRNRARKANMKEPTR